MTLSVVAVITAKPGAADTVRAALEALVPRTRAEDGCESYELFASNAPDTFVTVEAWRDAAALEAHLASEHIAATLAAAGEHLAAPPAIHSLSPV